VNKDSQKTIWLTGLPCSGKTTLAKRLKAGLALKGIRAVHLDADEIRGTLNSDLGFSEKDRSENLRRAAHVARLLNDHGVQVIASFVSPTAKMRRMIRGIVKGMKLVYLKCPVDVCESRDVKGMYAKARKGLIKGFTGVSAPFEAPLKADLVVDTSQHSIGYCVRKISERFFPGRKA
jgi:adenylylsulfate kinase